MEGKRLIEVDFPLKEVSEESVREKNIRHGHISTLHIWWARRPLAASRATTYAALVPAPSDNEELREKLKFIAELSKWENSLNQRLVEKARKEIRDSFGERAPKVLDCFAGGGAIPLEALRLGCETYALEYNPVAVLILKAVLEYPQKFGKPATKIEGGLRSSTNPLVEDVKKWENWALEEARKEIGRFYPPDPDGSIPIGYIWARTIRCQNPTCRVEIPLMRQFWLAKKKDKRVALKMVIDRERKQIDFRVVENRELDFDPSEGTTQRATVLCPICGSGMAGDVVRQLFREGKAQQRLVAVVVHKPRQKGKTYRIANERDLELYRKAGNYLWEKRQRLLEKWGLDPIPVEPLPDIPGHTNVYRYGMTSWDTLFNDRQKLALVTLTEKVKLVYETMIRQACDREYAKTVVTYLSFAVSRSSDFCNCLVRWALGREVFTNMFARQAIPMVWDYMECNIFSTLANIPESMFRQVVRVIDNLVKIDASVSEVRLGTATNLPFPNDYFHAVITDPPYYDNIPYSDLSDFFYVWLKRTIGDLYPEMFATPLAPKSLEIVKEIARGKDAAFFEVLLTEAFREIYRVMEPDGIGVIVFAHKSTEAWETIISSLLKSGLVLTASWPIHTEMRERLVARESAALASSVYMVCRKRVKEQVAYLNDIKPEVERIIREKLGQFWAQGITGADFFVSAIGPAVEVFGKYSKVEKLSGEEVSVQELLEYVRKVVSEFALERVLKRADLGGVDAETRFYLLWRWTFGNARVHFDDAIKLSRPMGVELTQLWDGGGFIKKEKEFIRVLDPKERARDPSFMKKTKFTSMIDVLHHVLVLWEEGDKKRIKEVLDETGYAGNEMFWQTAQAISEVLPEGDKERQLLQGFLYGKEIYVKEAKGKGSLVDFLERG